MTRISNVIDPKITVTVTVTVILHYLVIDLFEVDLSNFRTMSHPFMKENKLLKHTCVGKKGSITLNRNCLRTGHILASLGIDKIQGWPDIRTDDQSAGRET